MIGMPKPNFWLAVWSGVFSMMFLGAIESAIRVEWGSLSLRAGLAVFAAVMAAMQWDGENLG